MFYMFSDCRDYNLMYIHVAVLFIRSAFCLALLRGNSHTIISYYLIFVSDIAIFVLKRDVKLQLTN